jgi:hypothetical protein
MIVEAYAVEGVASGAVSGSGGVRDALETTDALAFDELTWFPLGAAAPEHPQRGRLPLDDVIAVAGDFDEVPVHATWHEIHLDAGPYRISGELPTMPGFDPGRALSRPTGRFIMLREVRIELGDRPDAGRADRPFALVHRYVIDRVRADIDLGFYFPGAVFETLAGLPAG